MKKFSFISFVSLFFILVFTPHVSAEVKKETVTSTQSYQATMTPSYQEISGNTASWSFSWRHSPGPYKIYFSPDTGVSSRWVADVGASSYSYSYKNYTGSGPALYYPSIRIANGNYDPAFGEATVYKRP